MSRGLLSVSELTSRRYTEVTQTDEGLSFKEGRKFRFFLFESKVPVCKKRKIFHSCEGGEW